MLHLRWPSIIFQQSNISTKFKLKYRVPSLLFLDCLFFFIQIAAGTFLRWLGDCGRINGARVPTDYLSLITHIYYVRRQESTKN